VAKRFVVPYQANLFLERAAHKRIQAIGRDDQVIFPKLLQRLDLGLIPRHHAGGADALLEQRQQFKPADRRKPDAIDLDALAAQVERDVVPAFHPRRDGVDRVGIVGAQEFQRLFGKHNPKAPGGAFRVLFEQLDPGVGVTPLPEIGEIEPAGAPADHGDAQGLLP
jgi:hypothetical protein